MTKDELISEISMIMELGMEDDLLKENKCINEMEYCTKLLDDYTKDITLRLRADLDNEKKRLIKIQQTKIEQIRFNTLSDFTEILDDLEFFKDIILDSSNKYIKTGFLLINKKIDKFLKQSKIEIINTDIPFDVDLHECVSVMDDKKEKGTILKVASRGYKVDDTIIKYPKVIVQS